MFVYQEVENWDEIPLVSPLSEPKENDMEDGTVTSSPALNELMTGKEGVDVFDVPEPLALITKRAELKAALVSAAETKNEDTPFSPFNPEVFIAMSALPPVARVRRKRSGRGDSAPMTLEDPWFTQSPNYEALVQESPKKKSWFASFKEKVGQGLDRVMEKFGIFLDTAVPTISAAAVAVTLGTLGSQLSDFNQIAKASSEGISKSAVMVATPGQQVQATVAHFEAKTLAETQPNSTRLNELLVTKNVEIVQVAGGSKANYLFSATDYAHLLSELSKPGRGFGRVLAHPAMKKARNIAELVNLVETHFGERVADLVESNAAAMHLSTSQIEALR